MLGNKEIMADNIRYYMKKNNKSRNEICRDLDFAYSTFTDWINAKKYPRIDKIEMMARYFCVSKADLVEERSAASLQRTLTQDESDLLDDFQKLNAEGKTEARKQVRNLTKIEDYTKDTGSSAPAAG